MLPVPAHEFDPDDNYAAGDAGGDEDLELTVEGLVWQLLLLVNPGDEDAALQQFHAWQEDQAGAGARDPLDALRQAIDWRAGFHVAADDPGGLIECVDELAARFGVDIDWGSDDSDDEDFLRETDVATLIGVAHARLREHGYALWTWSAHGAPREEEYAGWITLRSDGEALEYIAPALGIELRPGSAF